MTNDRFHLLVKRSVLLRDSEATEEIQEYLLKKLFKKYRTVKEHYGASEAEEVLDAMLLKANSAALATTKKVVERPRNYVMRAASNSYIDEIEKLEKRRLRELSEGSSTVPDGLFHCFPVLAEDEVESRLIMKSLSDLEGGPVFRKAVQVIKLVYWLEVSEREACALLDFGDTERDTVLRSLRRLRTNPDSQLHRWYRGVGR